MTVASRFVSGVRRIHDPPSDRGRVLQGTRRSVRSRDNASGPAISPSSTSPTCSANTYASTRRRSRPTTASRWRCGLPARSSAAAPNIALVFAASRTSRSSSRAFLATASLARLLTSTTIARSASTPTARSATPKTMPSPPCSRSCRESSSASWTSFRTSAIGRRSHLQPTPCVYTRNGCARAVIVMGSGSWSAGSSPIERSAASSSSRLNCSARCRGHANPRHRPLPIVTFLWQGRSVRTRTGMSGV